MTTLSPMAHPLPNSITPPFCVPSPSPTVSVPCLVQKAPNSQSVDDLKNSSSVPCSSSSEGVSSSSSSSSSPSLSKVKPILGPGGQHYTPGEAAKLGLTIRTACEACRTRKLKCSGTSPEQGGCLRCKSDKIQCIYSARAPIGRPKKRKTTEENPNEVNDKSHKISTPRIASVSSPSFNTVKQEWSDKPSLHHNNHHPRNRSTSVSQLTTSSTSSVAASWISHHVASCSDSSSDVPLYRSLSINELISAAATIDSPTSMTQALDLSPSSVLQGTGAPTFILPELIKSKSFSHPSFSSSLAPSFAPPPSPSYSSSAITSHPFTHPSPPSTYRPTSQPHSVESLLNSPIHDLSSSQLLHSRYSSVPQPYLDGSHGSSSSQLLHSRYSSAPQACLDGNPALFIPSRPLPHDSHPTQQTTPSWLQTELALPYPHDQRSKPKSQQGFESLSHSASNSDDGQSTQHPSPFSFNDPTRIPSLDDLSIAAFLQSLDTLEIAPSELFQQNYPQQYLQQQQQQSTLSSSAGKPTPQSSSLSEPIEVTASNPMASQPIVSAETVAATIEEWTSSSAILQPGLSFAVPADFSWWDLSFDIESDSNAASTNGMGTPSVDDGNPTSASSLQQTFQSTGETDVSSPIEKRFKLGSLPLDPHPSSSSSSRFSWPRGVEAGMGQGYIHETRPAASSGLGWSTFSSSSLLTSPSSASAISTAACQLHHRSALSDDVSIQPDPLQQGKLCCSNRLKQEEKSKTCVGTACSPPLPSPLAQLSPKIASASTSASDSCKTAVLARNESESLCCSKKPTSNRSNVLLIKPEPEPTEPDTHSLLTTTSEVPTTKSCCSSSKAASCSSSNHAIASCSSSSPPPPSKVHCVPNPSGKGCTCLCDVSVALLSVKRILRETKQNDTPKQASTIQLTLSASQAIAAQCACSADCPTCRSDPSTEISASLLVSTALQIYARAVRTLRETFAGNTNTNNSNSVGGGGIGGLEVKIGEYRPIPSNARKIAMFAMKLELRDLRTALGKISKMVENISPNNNVVAPRWSGKINPIDQLVILKLYQQLGELLVTVESLETCSST